MKDELMNVKIKFTEQSARLAELKQEVSRLETKVIKFEGIRKNHCKKPFRIPRCKLKVN